MKPDSRPQVSSEGGHAGAITMQTLTPKEAKSFYDKFGKKQDRQAFYELPAIRELLSNCALHDAHSIFEFGCGTGRLALELLRHHLPHDAVYCGIDISTTMVRIASRRLAPFGGRATVALTGSTPAFPIVDGLVDRVVSTYVLDLLSDCAVDGVLAEARRTLRPEGLLCLAGITFGTTPVSRIVMGAWRRLFAMNPSLVGGCRPTDTVRHLTCAGWNIRFDKVVVAWGIGSQVVVASPTAAA